LASIVEDIRKPLRQIECLAEVEVTVLKEIVERVTRERNRFRFVEIEPKDVLETSAFLFETD